VGSALGERPSPSRSYTRAVNGTSTAPNGTIGMPSRAAHHHIDLAAAAAGADQPLAPIEHGGIGAIPGSHLGGIGRCIVNIDVPINSFETKRCTVAFSAAFWSASECLSVSTYR
jgi:hypothetical protein